MEKPATLPLAAPPGAGPLPAPNWKHRRSKRAAKGADWEGGDCTMAKGDTPGFVQPTLSHPNLFGSTCLRGQGQVPGGTAGTGARGSTPEVLARTLEPARALGPRGLPRYRRPHLFRNPNSTEGCLVERRPPPPPWEDAHGFSRGPAPRPPGFPL